MAALLDHHRLSDATFAADTHAARYLGALTADRLAFDRLIDLINRPESARALTSVPPGQPALAGIVALLEADPVLARAVSSGPGSLRFRQGVGVAVRLRMEQLGWRTTGQKGTVRGSKFLGKAERYVPAADLTPADRARAALGRVMDIGSDEERTETSVELQRALLETRRAAGRPF